MSELTPLAKMGALFVIGCGVLIVFTLCWALYGVVTE